MARSRQGTDNLVSKTIDSVVNGVSQQPPTVRLGSQCEVQDNVISKIVEGASRRPPTEHVAILHSDALPSEGYFTHIRNRDQATQHQVLIENGNIRVFNLFTGLEAIVTGATGYLDIAGDTASEAYAVVSVADYSFIVNKETVVAMSGSLTAARTNEFLIYMIEAGASSSNLDWLHALGEVPGPFGFTPQVSDNSVGELVEELMIDVYNDTNYPRWGFTQVGKTVMHGYQEDDLTNRDAIGQPSWEYSDEVYSFVGAQAQKFSDLPRLAPDGFVTEVTGGDGNEDNNYWVRYDGALTAWVETVGPELDNAFNNTTLPHVLIQTSAGQGAGGADEFTFGPQTWADRTKGDVDSAPEPSFVGKRITDVTFHKNRLTFTADEHTVLSEAGEFFNFWPTTVTTIVDSDPIDIAGTNNRVALIDFAIPFDGRLFTFSGHGGVQNALSSGTDGLTVGKAEMDEVSAFASALHVRPQAAGSSIFFAVDHGVASEIKEYTIEDSVADGDSITSHVPTYIPSALSHLAVSAKNSAVALLSATTPNIVYFYSYFYSNRDKVQSSWSRWIFDDAYVTHGLDWVDDALYLVVERDDGLHLEKANLSTLTDGDLDHRIYLDSLITVQGVYTQADQLTRWTMPYEADDGDFRAVLSTPPQLLELGRAFDLTLEVSSGKLYAEGDYSADDVHIGRKYLSDYEFTKPTIMLTGGDTQKGAAPVTQGRLQVRNMKVLTRNSGGFEARVSSDEVNPAEILAEQDEYVYEFPDKIVDAGTIGPMNPRPVDEFTFDVGMEAKHARIRITSNSHLPFTIVGAEWMGHYTAIPSRI